MIRLKKKNPKGESNALGPGIEKLTKKIKECEKSEVLGSRIQPRSDAKKRPFGRKRHSSGEIWFTDVPPALIDSSHDDDTTGRCLVKTHSFRGMTRTIAIDCEFVGVGYEGKEDALARVSVVNQFGHVLLDEYVRPKEKVTDYRTAFSGIAPHHIRKDGSAKSFEAVQSRVAELFKGRILVGHAVHNDLRVLMLSHPRKDIRDTSRYKPFRELFKGRNPSLKALTDRLLGVQVQRGEHDSVEDARATMRIYTMVKRIWEAQLKARRTGKPFKEIQSLSQHLHFPSAVVETTTQSEDQKVKLTRLAKIALDVNSEFAPGISHNGITPKPPTQMNANNPVMISRKSDHAVMMNGRRCSKHRQRFLEKRRRIRQRSSATSSKNSSVFS